MAAKGDDRVASASFLAAQVDFSEAGDLLVFIDDTQLKALEEMSKAISTARAWRCVQHAPPARF